MHTWGDESVDWQGIDDAAYYIAHHLATYFRIGVDAYKEKFGTVRVYCHFGWHGIYPIWRPSYLWYPNWWPMKLDFWVADTRIWQYFNKVVVRLQMKMYAFVYKCAVQKWPHLYKEIVSHADYGKLFEGVIPGYKHSDYWTKL